MERRGEIKKGYTLIEATSGNCGIGLSMISAVKGYKPIITMPDRMSLEKKYILNSMGAECIRTPSDAPFNTPESLIGVAYRLNKEIPTSKFLDQYSDDSNALVNYDETAEEYWNDIDGKVDYVVLTVGTGGTISGIARKFKERNPQVKVIGVDPQGSQLALPNCLNENKCPFKVEGIGYDFVPKNLDQKSVDQWFKVEDKDSFTMARRIIREEGLLVGGSSGSCMWAALKIAKSLPADKRVCVVFCDGIRNYMSKYISDDWMIDNKFYSEQEVEDKSDKFKLQKVYGKNTPIKDLIDELQIGQIPSLNHSVSIEETVKVLKEGKLDCVPIVNETTKQLIGVATYDMIIQKLFAGYIKYFDCSSKVATPNFKRLHIDEPISRICRAFKVRDFVLVYDSSHNKYVVTPQNLVEYIKLKEENNERF